jgi:hypothetical protein
LHLTLGARKNFENTTQKAFHKNAQKRLVKRRYRWRSGDVGHAVFCLKAEGWAMADLFGCG